MAVQNKPKRAWCYLSEEDQRRLEALTTAVGSTLSEVSILSTLVSAGLKACDEAGSRMPLPLKFEIKEDDPPPKPLTKTRR